MRVKVACVLLLLFGGLLVARETDPKTSDRSTEAEEAYRRALIQQLLQQGSDPQQERLPYYTPPSQVPPYSVVPGGSMRLPPGTTR